MNTSQTNQIEKSIQLSATQHKVWSALSDAQEFSAWFGCRLEGAFVAGEKIAGGMSCGGAKELPMELWVEKIEPESFFSFRWHPCAVDPAVDYSQEATTLVEFRLEAQGTETLLRVTESGFDKIPDHRRDEAFRMNTGGWEHQMGAIESYVTG